MSSSPFPLNFCKLSPTHAGSVCDTHANCRTACALLPTSTKSLTSHACKKIGLHGFLLSFNINIQYVLCKGGTCHANLCIFLYLAFCLFLFTTVTVWNSGCVYYLCCIFILMFFFWSASRQEPWDHPDQNWFFLVFYFVYSPQLSCVCAQS